MTVSAVQADAFSGEVLRDVRRTNRACLAGAAAMALLALAGCARPDVPVPPVSPSPPVVAVSVTLGHCGFDPLVYRGATWEASPEPFDATNAPSSWQGRGTVTEVSPSRLLYRDDSGVEVTFAPDAEVPPRGTCA